MPPLIVRWSWEKKAKLNFVKFFMGLEKCISDPFFYSFLPNLDRMR